MRNTASPMLIILGIFLPISILVGFYFVLKRPQPILKMAEVDIGENTFSVEVASTTISRARGLSGRDGLAEGEGMFFVFDNLGTDGFWMKDMKFSIDIIWIANDRVVGFAENAAPEPGVPLWKLKIYYPPAPVDRVLEVSAGTVQKLGIRTGDPVTFSAP